MLSWEQQRMKNDLLKLLREDEDIKEEIREIIRDD